MKIVVALTSMKYGQPKKLIIIINRAGENIWALKFKVTIV